MGETIWNQIRLRCQARNNLCLRALVSVIATVLICTVTPEQARANGDPSIEASVSLTTSSPTRASELTFRIQFREVVTGLDVADFDVTGFSDNGAGPGTTAQVTDVEPVLPAGPFPQFRITVGSGDLAEFSGQVGLGFSTGAEVLVGDQTRSPTVNPRANQAYIVDNTAPRVRSIVRQNPSTSQTNLTELVFRVAFDEAVEDVTTASFAVTGGSTAEVTGIDPVAGGLAYDVTVSGGNLDAYSGQVGLSVIIDTDSPIQDAVGNALASSALISDSEEFTIDTIGPRLGNVSRAPGSDAITNEDVVVF
ncbi:MAG: hypothetical protein NXH88_19515, partial [Hyphomonas sp.]|nr:hypothetical protein [Hyphomonas sp.]